MTQIAYTVTAALPDRGMFDRYIAWLEDGHLAGLIASGATAADLIVLDPEDGAEFRVQSSYRFPDRAAFDRYVAEHAPKLRADGLEKFGPQTGVVMTRTIGQIRIALRDA